jgi:glutathione synthase/RimK-type ligase-like ATP-grasp enzyme
VDQKYVGVILPDGIYNVLLQGKTQINVRAYQEAGDHFGLTPLFFIVKNLKPGRDEINAFIKQETGYKLESFPIPNVIYSRSFLSKRQMNYLSKMNVQIYNTKGISQNKYKMNQIISDNKELRPHLPATEKATKATVQLMMERFSRLILKPANGSLGGGIMKLVKKADESWMLHYPVARRKWEEVTFTNVFPEVLLTTIEAKAYIIQEQISLAKHQEMPFDMRVVVQRDHTGDWVLAGVLCKVATQKDRFVTNISQGGRSLSFDRVFKSHPYLSYQKVYEEIEVVSLKIAKHLEHYTDHIADIALDLAVDEDGHLFFIESNFRGRYGNVKYKGKRYEEWRAKHWNPIGYARFLIDNTD